jgi:hypothetical protein
MDEENVSQAFLFAKGHVRTSQRMFFDCRRAMKPAISILFFKAAASDQHLGYQLHRA